ncbi:MAG: NUDIX domain-containing protein [Nanoarchaeota archaeon]
MKIVQKVVLEQDGKYLILLRPADKKSHPSHWDFPGGKLEKDEDPIDGVIREVKEETNLDVKITGKHSTHEEEINGKPNRFITYHAEVLGGEVKLSEEHVDHRWAKEEEIKKLEKLNPTVKSYFFP